MLGVNLTSRDVKECNKRGCFHIHGQAQGGATPELIAFVAEDARLRSVQKREKWTPALALAPNLLGLRAYVSSSRPFLGVPVAFT